jgi:hypothetical protein
LVGSGSGNVSRSNPINPSNRRDNCSACVAANIRNKLERREPGNLVNADQIEANVAYAGASRGLSEAQSVAFIEKATDTTAIRHPIGAPDAPIGNYATYATGPNGGHVMYGQRLPNGRYYFYDPQVGGKAMTLQEARAKYNLTRTYYMAPIND